MATPKFASTGKGSWAGKSRLNLPWLPKDKQISESASKLHIDLDELNTFATITYTWEHEGKRHEGSMLVCGSAKSKDVQVAWVDSWHQSTSVLYLKGKEDAKGNIKSKGTYDAEGQTWGWTIAFELAEDTLTMRMENVMPDDKADWAVEAVYKRA